MESGTAETTSEWVFVARSVGQLPNGQAQALGCMARAQVVAESVTDWLNVALAWHQDFDDLDLARQCLALAEAKAGYDPDAWEHIAESVGGNRLCSRSREVSSRGGPIRSPQVR